MIRRVGTVVAALAFLFTATTALAAPVTISSQHLAATSLAVPVLYPNSLVTANSGGTLHKAAQSDSLTVVYSAELMTSSLCNGAGTTTGTVSVNLTVTITSNAAPSGNDLLALGPIGTATCPGDGLIHFGTVDLGSTAYVASGVASFLNSTVSLTNTTTSSTLAITLGTASGSATAVAPSGASATYVPDAAITDVLGNPIRASTALTTALVQF